ncbi:MAG: two-component regulator propeller domain-containing protein [Bacteroidota bacterium]
MNRKKKGAQLIDKSNHIKLLLRTVWVLLCVVCFPQFSFSQSSEATFQFQNFTQKEGLASNYVIGITQDHKGFIWIATENGLNRFDGQHFITFRNDPNDEETINNNRVWSILEDSQHNLWVSSEGGLSWLNRKTGKFIRIPLKENNQTVPLSGVRHIQESTDGTIWVSTIKEGIFRVEKETEGQEWKLSRFSYEVNGRPETNVRTYNIPYATSDVLWVANSKGINQVDINTKKAIRHPFPTALRNVRKEFEYLHTSYNGNGKIFTGINDQLLCLDIREKVPEIKTWESFNANPIQRFPISGEIVYKDPNTLLIPSYQDIYVFYLDNGSLKKVKIDGQTSSHLFSVHVHASFVDKQGNYWLGTAGQGLFRAQKKKKAFTFYKYDPGNPSSISSGQVRSIIEVGKGRLWTGILNHGIDVLETQENGLLKRVDTFKPISGQPNSPQLSSVIKLIKDKEGNIWVATNVHGLIQLDLNGKMVNRFYHDPENKYSISGNRIWGLAQDQQGYIWAGTWIDGLNRLDIEKKEFKNFRHDPTNSNSLVGDNVRYILVSKSGDLWIGSDQGLVKYDKENDQFEQFQNNPLDPHSLSTNLVWSIYEDSKGFLWIGTGSGLNRYDPVSRRFERFYEDNGLPDNSIYGILEDDEGLLWISTKNGLARQIPSSSEVTFRPFLASNDLPTTAFVPKAFLNSRYSEQLFFGSAKGLLAIKPSLLQQDSAKTELVINEMKVYKRKEVSVGIETDYFISNKEGTLNLGYDDLSVSFVLADLNRIEHSGYKYEYQLSGFNNQWTPLEDNMQVSFSNLRPGTYTLRARAKNLENSSVGEVNLLKMKVFPPWWRSWVAYIFYGIAVLSILLVLFNFYLREQLEKKEAENLRALDAYKNKLFTNITHEFRTPLTIISGMNNQIKKRPQQWLDEGTNLIQKNTDNLLDLINQILELQKVESGKLKLDLKQGNIIPFLENIFVQFQAYSQSKEQKLTLDAQVKELNMDYDAEKILRIVSNLLSNAIKFAPEKGKVDFRIAKSKKKGRATAEGLLLTVTDNGPGIPEEQLPHIFNRFFQASVKGEQTKSGSGIGLSLTQELVKLMQGEIEVESLEGEGATFKVFLPITQNAPLNKSTEPSNNVQEAIFGLSGKNKTAVKTTEKDLPLALIVEDNKDIVDYLQAFLSGTYRLEVAYDGQAGIDKALDLIPDIIISDVMMPNKDGFELCETLKEDVRTSHIPLILLTAKSDVESRIVGLKHGADDYLGKPFHEEELIVRMQNLLDIRKKLQARYQNIYEQPIQKETTSEPDKEDDFILSLKVIFEEKMDDPQFDLNALSKAMNLSRSQLGRKVKALTGRSLSVYIRSLRLQKARQLLLSTDLSMKNIAYDVGFPNPSYFTASYTQEFAESPTNTREMRR